MEKTSRKTTRRYWRRTSLPRPWWPWGVAPLAGLGVLFLVGALLVAPRIEADIRAQVSEEITAAGLPAFDVRSDGQGVTIKSAAQAEEELYLHAVAASTRCDTWAGKLTCPTSVDIRRIETTDTETSDTPAVLDERRDPFTGESTASIAAAERPTPGEPAGTTQMQGTGSASKYLDDEQCNTEFENILGNATIRFRTGSAIIDAGNDVLLDELADAASRCPGNLTVQGHTDSRGDAAGNKALSLARATAVRDALVTRGIEADRLAARGFGESQPIADNSTLAGRAKNRRIVITIGDTQ